MNQEFFTVVGVSNRRCRACGR